MEGGLNPGWLRPSGVFGRQDGMADLVCYCFGYTAADIERDVTENGKSLIFEKIATAKQAGGCSCAIKNPSGR